MTGLGITQGVVVSVKNPTLIPTTTEKDDLDPVVPLRVSCTLHTRTEIATRGSEFATTGSGIIFFVMYVNCQAGEVKQSTTRREISHHPAFTQGSTDT